jgi:hypothetical protein
MNNKLVLFISALLIIPTAFADLIDPFYSNPNIPLHVITSILITIILELIVYQLILKQTWKKSLIFLTILNILTWIPANLSSDCFSLSLDISSFLSLILILELLVIIIEAIVIYYFNKKSISKLKSFLTSLLMNLTSAILGLIILYIIMDSFYSIYYPSSKVYYSFNTSAEFAVTTLESTCVSKCRILRQLSPPMTGIIDENQMNFIKSFCCENLDLDSNGIIEASTTFGPEYCALAYTECRISEKNPSQFCIGQYNEPLINQTSGETEYIITDFDFTTVQGCGLE